MYVDETAVKLQHRLGRSWQGMDRFLVEIPHDPDAASCRAAIKVFAETGSHYLTHADFGCEDGVHNAWLFIEADGHDEARLVAPPQYRRNATATLVKRYAMTGSDAPHSGRPISTV